LEFVLVYLNVPSKIGGARIYLESRGYDPIAIGQLFDV